MAACADGEVRVLRPVVVHEPALVVEMSYAQARYSADIGLETVRHDPLWENRLAYDQFARNFVAVHPSR